MENKLKLTNENAKKVNNLMEEANGHLEAIELLSITMAKKRRKAWLIIRESLKLDPNKEYAYNSNTNEVTEIL